MSKQPGLLLGHPLSTKPYDTLAFVRLSPQRTALYSVAGCTTPPKGARRALAHAFSIHGGACFYCSRKFSPQPLSPNVGIDHVVPLSDGGGNHLHNLVIACSPCNMTKAADTLAYFRPNAAERYLDALDRHIRACIAGL